jgi:hypothetical protein
MFWFHKGFREKREYFKVSYFISDYFLSVSDSIWNVSTRKFEEGQEGWAFFRMRAYA